MHALAAARLLGLSVKQATHAQGIALSMAAGNLEFLQDGAWTKRLHPGWAAVGGTTAATLAKHDYIGPGATYEGRFGLYALYMKQPLGEGDIGLATAGLGKTWEIRRRRAQADLRVPFHACVVGCSDRAASRAWAEGRRESRIAKRSIADCRTSRCRTPTSSPSSSTTRSTT